MTRGIEWREPFDTGHAGAMRDALDASVNSLESVTQLCGETMALRRPTGGITDPYDIVDHIFDRTGVQCEDRRLMGEGGKGVVQLVRRDGTDVAEALGQHQIGARLSQEIVFQAIELLSRRH
jgi:hypothetical protein